ncbi:hypothetical protein ACWGI9_10875 [Streptomyces sp. NPDC054833]
MDVRYGWGQLVVAFAPCRQTVFGLLISDSDARPSGTLIGSATLLAGLIVMTVGRLAGGKKS